MQDNSMDGVGRVASRTKTEQLPREFVWLLSCRYHKVTRLRAKQGIPPPRQRIKLTMDLYK